MTFEQWAKNKFIRCDAEYAQELWDTATQAERERCLTIARAYDENGMTLVRIEHPEMYEHKEIAHGI